MRKVIFPFLFLLGSCGSTHEQKVDSIEEVKCILESYPHITSHQTAICSLLSRDENREFLEKTEQGLHWKEDNYWKIRSSKGVFQDIYKVHIKWRYDVPKYECYLEISSDYETVSYSKCHYNSVK